MKFRIFTMNTTYINLAVIVAFLAPWTVHALTSSMVGVVLSTEHFPYIGSGYLDYAGQGSFAEWNNVTVPTAGTYTLLVHYANGASGSNRICDLTINGEDRGTVDFPCVYTDSVLGAGTYSAADINSLYGTGRQFSGTGWLTVIPEPATIGLTGAFGVGALFIHRFFVI
ncbi:MAG: hypothetical protein JXR25_15580 [Pontiellaceae bacterium]|nr:hypothetical protein [Pontiellaceae bacterium]MBN2786241.1 hypothetical protein [Pontiellaceae bacterium]